MFCIFSLTVISNAQNTFIKTLGGVGDDIVNSVIQSRDGNFILIGSTTSFGSGGSDGYVSKVNGSAKEIWDKAVGGSADDNFQHGIQLINGDYLLVGWTASYGNGDNDMLVTKFDSFGGIIWSKTFGGTNDDRGYYVLETSDGNILIGGHTKSFGSGNLDVYILKLTTDGDEIWSKTYGTSENDWFNGQGLIEDKEGNYVVAGAWKVNSGSFEHDGVFMKLNANGDIITLKGYGGAEDDGFAGYLKESANGFQNIGGTWSWNGANHEIWMSDLTLDGDINWSKTFGLAGQNIRIGSVQPTMDGDYLISGYEFSQQTNGAGNALLLKVSSTGDVLWSKSYGGSGIEVLEVAFETDNGVIAFGKTTSNGEGGNDIYVVRTDALGTVSGCSDNLIVTINDVIPESRNPNFAIDNISLGELQVLDVSDVNNVENVVCDGCDATGLVAGLFCDTAPIICSIDCLDGFTGTLPDNYTLPQPEPLCTGGDGNPNNLSWFAFVAGSNSIDLSIIPTNCNTIMNDAGNPTTIGIQAAVYEDCTFESSFICQTDGCNDLIAETLTIASNQFVEGQVYYLLVDGCGGSVCDYEVVVNSAQQAFEMDEITTISNDLGIDIPMDSLCLGTEITFTLDDFDQDVNFNWSIDPPTSNYPSGVHPVIDTNSVAFQFDEEGCFDIHVYAYNECDNSETKTFSVCVKKLEDEVFSDIYVCQECFPITLITPESGCIITSGGGAPTVLIEDPNNDGVPGWSGTSTIAGPGLDSNLVTNMFGCTFMQYVNVVEIPLSPREQVDYYFCLEDFPVTIDGSTFNMPGDTRNITIDGGAASGCDSLLSVTAHAIDFLGSLSIGNCDGGEVVLAMVVNDISITNYDSISYVWYDENANIVTDSDGVDSIFTVTNVGSYTVRVFIHYQGDNCEQTFGPIMVDIDNLSPSVPSISYAPIEVCTSELLAQIYVADQNIGESYVWTFTPNLPFSFGLSSDTVYVDVTSGEDFEFCVYAENGCGSTAMTCDDVVVIDSPDSEFNLDTEICIDSLAMVVYTGSSGISSSSVFNWDFDGGIIRNGMDPNSGGPFELEFPNAGQYTIGLILSESGCNSILTSYNIEVIQPFSPPLIDCERGAGSVTFTWDDTGVDSVEVFIISGQTTYAHTDSSCVVTGLNSEEEVMVQFIFNVQDICGGVPVLANCTSLPCADVELSILLSDQDICFENASDVLLDIIIAPDDSEVGAWESPFITNNIFDVSAAGVGEHLIYYTYELGDCSYSQDTILTLYATPIVDTDVTLSLCEEMGNNLLDINTSSSNTVLLDGEMISILEGIEVEVGDHTLIVTNPDGCDMQKDFTVDNLGVDDLEILGDTIITKGESANYSVSLNSNLEDFILTWTLGADTICVDCYDVNISPNEAAELCVSILYGDGCSLTECITIEVNTRTELYIPNAFSPNNDNVNDHFTIHSNNNSVFVEEIMIFDRWGEMIFNRKGVNVSEESLYWDGTKNGNLCLEGVYVYIISYLDEENRSQRINGDLTLVR